MTRVSTFLWIVVIVAATFSLYLVKYRVQAIRAQIAETSRQLEAEKEALHVVGAEWAYLNRPQRLQAMATKYLGAKALTVDQIAEVEAIPLHGVTKEASADAQVRPASFSPEPSNTGDAE